MLAPDHLTPVLKCDICSTNSSIKHDFCAHPAQIQKAITQRLHCDKDKKSQKHCHYANVNLESLSLTVEEQPSVLTPVTIFPCLTPLPAIPPALCNRNFTSYTNRAISIFIKSAHLHSHSRCALHSFPSFGVVKISTPSPWTTRNVLNPLLWGFHDFFNHFSLFYVTSLIFVQVLIMVTKTTLHKASSYIRTHIYGDPLIYSALEVGSL